MTVEPRTDLAPQTIPQPRAPEDDAVDPRPGPETPALGEFPWPEPWHFSRAALTRSEYWDAATASWHSRGPIFPPRED